MKALAHHDRLIAIVGTAVLTVAFVVGVLRPGQLKAKSIQAEVSQVQTQLSTLPVQIAEREYLQAQLEGKREHAARLVTLVPFQADVSNVVQAVARLAKQSQVTITRLEPMPQMDFDSYSALPLSLGCKGDFNHVAKFLSGLESLPRLVTFGDVALIRDTKANDRQVQANVSISVYFRHSKSARIAGNAASPDSLASDN